MLCGYKLTFTDVLVGFWVPEAAELEVCVRHWTGPVGLSSQCLHSCVSECRT